MTKLFISYSHKDEEMISKFLNHLAPLKHNGKIKEWYDRKIMTGDSFQDTIDNNLENADIICLMISDNFLASKACLEEKDVALKFRNEKGIRVIPVILSPCAWTMHSELSHILASPTDGKPITSFSDANEGWVNVIGWVNEVCDSIIKVKGLKVATEFDAFLKSADILTKSHWNKEILNLSDIFVYPQLRKFDEDETSHKYDSSKIKSDLIRFGKLLISGENQAGKTTFCKVLFEKYRELNFIPIYLQDDNKYLGNPLKKLEKAFVEQYDEESLEGFDINRVVPIVDNFHFAKHQEKYIEQYDSFKNQIIIVDDIFNLNLRNQNLLKEYDRFKIREFSPIERNELIKKWIEIKEDSQIQMNPNHLQQSIDEKTELIERSLGKVFGKGIMPSYPFFILSLLAAQDTQKPLDQDITSQGYCYQALIYLYLRKEGVTNQQIDIYINFLTELSFKIFENQSNGFSSAEFDAFINYYTSNYNMPLSITEVVKKLSNVRICSFDSFNQYNFCYSYIYYFFVAKYISEHIEDNKERINKILANLHTDENAYITIFIAHHTKSDYLLDELLLNAEILFEKYTPSTLNSEELSFFDKHEDKIIQAVLPEYNHDSQQERQEQLIEKAKKEEKEDIALYEGDSIEEVENEEVFDLLTNLRLSIKTVEVMGMIIKNRSGSLGLKRLEYIFEQGLKVHLRILSSFIEIIKDENAEIEITEFIKERINSIIEERESENERRLSIEKIEKLAREIFWNVNFGVIHGFISKAINSLGSSNLINVSQNVSNKENTPSAFIVNQGINMWYGKSIKIDEIASRIKDKDFSITAERLLKIKIVEHCRLHKIAFKDIQRLEQKLQLNSKKILAENAKVE